jgi:co-chaperonin GroES (HSP10)
MNFDNFKPMNGRILVEVLEEEVEYKGAIHLAPQSKEKSNVGIVKAVYDEYDGETPKVKIGDKIIYPLHTGAIFHSGSKFENNKKEFRIIKESEIYGILNDS